jgi:hypothetical protein
MTCPLPFRSRRGVATAPPRLAALGSDDGSAVSATDGRTIADDATQTGVLECAKEMKRRMMTRPISTLRMKALMVRF